MLSGAGDLVFSRDSMCLGISIYEVILSGLVSVFKAHRGHPHGAVHTSRIMHGTCCMRTTHMHTTVLGRCCSMHGSCMLHAYYYAYAACVLPICIFQHWDDVATCMVAACCMRATRTHTVLMNDIACCSLIILLLNPLEY